MHKGHKGCKGEESAMFIVSFIYFSLHGLSLFVINKCLNIAFSFSKAPEAYGSIVYVCWASIITALWHLLSVRREFRLIQALSNNMMRDKRKAINHCSSLDDDNAKVYRVSSKVGTFMCLKLSEGKSWTSFEKAIKPLVKWFSSFVALESRP